MGIHKGSIQAVALITFVFICQMCVIVINQMKIQLHQRHLYPAVTVAMKRIGTHWCPLTTITEMGHPCRAFLTLTIRRKLILSILCGLCFSILFVSVNGLRLVNELN